MATLSLSQVQVDYEQIRQQFIDDLARRETWRDLIPASVGVTFAEWFSAIAVYEQYAIERALQETMPDTARLDSSIVTIARMLGVHIQRRIPARVTARFTKAANTVSASFPAYSRFIINGRFFFNRTDVFFPADSTDPQDVYLYEGEVVREDVIAEGGAFQSYYIGNGENTISDADLFCIAVKGPASQRFTATREGLWRLAENAAQFYENTMPDGTVEVRFGNGIYGAMPEAGTTLRFTYARTSGEDGNTTASNFVVEQGMASSVTGVTITPAAGGANALDAALYRTAGPNLYAARERMVTRQDWRTLALTYPGVVDAAFRGQAETNPGDLRWMNVVEYTLLTRTAWGAADHADFADWVAARGIFQVRLLRRDPTPVPVAVVLTVHCTAGANLGLAQGRAVAALQEFFALREGLLGYSVYLSDLYTAAKNSDPDIEFVTISQPLADRAASALEYPALASLTVNAAYTTRVTPG